MKKYILTILLSFVCFASFAQIDWINFDKVKVFPQNGHTAIFPSDSNVTDNSFREDQSWCITLGKELRKGVYIILDEDGYNTGSLISFGESGMSGLWGWLILEYTNAESPYKKDHANGKGFFHTRHYSLMLNPIHY